MTSVTNNKNKNKMTKTKLWVTMTDKFLSGWGNAKGKTNKLIIECDSWEQANVISYNAKRRSEMRHVNICIRKPRYGSNVFESWKHYDDLGAIWKEVNNN
jgi:hypothetical protein